MNIYVCSCVCTRIAHSYAMQETCDVWPHAFLRCVCVYICESNASLCPIPQQKPESIRMSSSDACGRPSQQNHKLHEDEIVTSDRMPDHVVFAAPRPGFHILHHLFCTIYTDPPTTTHTLPFERSIFRSRARKKKSVCDIYTCSDC